MRARELAGTQLAHDLKLAGFERFATHILILVQAINDAIKIEVSAPYRKIARPVVGVASKLYPARHFQFIDHIGAACDGLFVDDIRKRFALAPFAREHGHVAQSEEHINRAFLEIKSHGARIDDRGAGHSRERRGDVRQNQLTHQAAVAISNVFGSDGITVGEAGFRVQTETD